jgi:hypothetical protein
MQSVLVHQLSRHSSQNPFRKNRGRVQRVAFHPLKPFFFVATQSAVRIYNLAKQVGGVAFYSADINDILVQVSMLVLLRTKQNAVRIYNLAKHVCGVAVDKCSGW